jgi:methylated-DNA-[protein]-cysteine S-methyltransferase
MLLSLFFRFMEILPRALYNVSMNQKHALFAESVLYVVSQIPCGEVLTYQEVARRAGNKNAYRAVGNILNKNYDPRIPCHRVVRSDGSIGGYNRGAKKKCTLLKNELAVISM